MKKNLLLSLFLSTTLSVFSQKNFWTPVSAIEAIRLNAGRELFATFKPASYKLFTLDEASFAASLKQAPLEKQVPASKSDFIISFPVADGAIERFRISESPVMEPGLQSKYANIHSYVGQGLDDPSKTIRCDYTLLGFHAAVSSPNEKTFYVSSLNRKGRLYAVYSRSEKDAPPDIFKCTVDGSGVEEGGITGKKTPFTGNADDGTLRTYRLALCVAGEFSQFFLDGTEADTAEMKSKVMSVLTVYMDRANQVYERDFDVRLMLVDKEDTIIFINPQKDPFGSGSYNTASQKTCDNFIGSANYDIGHTITSKNLGGNAGCIGCVCLGTKKGSGYTGYNHPEILDYFVIDYWTHEVGHQFGANHTFDFSDEGTGANVEPGSGSTIMGYAGITGSTDVQPHSDDYFHAVSIAQNTRFIKTGFGNACAVKTVTGDIVPVINGGNDYTIPKSTPFALTGTATDGDAADILTYCWEQIDDYTSGTSSVFPKASSTDGPNFRSYNYVTSPVRYFPQMTDVLSGLNSNTWEVLSGVARTLDFRFTARDNHPGGGSNESVDVKITVDGKSGPFKVTVPNKKLTYGEGTTQTVEWDVAKTDVKPVNCIAVNISLSIDGGLTFPYVLAVTTANDGSEDVNIPLLGATTKQARIKVEAADNIFFDVSDKDFVIESALPLSWLSFGAERSGKFDALLKWSTANEVNNDHFEIERSKDGIGFSTLASVAAGTHPNAVQNYSYTDVHIPYGTSYYRIKQVDKDGRSSYSRQAQVTIDANGISWNVQPNPAKDHTVIVFNANANNVHLSISNANGKMVYRKILQSVSAGNELTIPLNNLAKGIYLLRIDTGIETRTEKIIIE